jgi:hypothetical protein
LEYNFWGRSVLCDEGYCWWDGAYGGLYSGYLRCPFSLGLKSKSSEKSEKPLLEEARCLCLDFLLFFDLLFLNIL